MSSKAELTQNFQAQMQEHMAYIQLQIMQSFCWLYCVAAVKSLFNTLPSDLPQHLKIRYFSKPQDFSGCVLSISNIDQLFKLGVRDFRSIIVTLDQENQKQDNQNKTFNRANYPGCLFYNATIPASQAVKAINVAALDTLSENGAPNEDQGEIESRLRTASAHSIHSTDSIESGDDITSKKKSARAPVVQAIQIVKLETTTKELEKLYTRATQYGLSGIELTSGKIAYLYNRGIRNFQGIIAKKQDFSGMRLRNCSFDCAHLEDSNFNNADCSNSTFSGTYIENTKFVNAKTHGAEFHHAIGWDEYHTDPNDIHAIPAEEKMIKEYYQAQKQLDEPNHRYSYNQARLSGTEAYTKSIKYTAKANTLEELRDYCVKIMADFVKSDTGFRRYIAQHTGFFQPKTARQETQKLIHNINSVASLTPKDLSDLLIGFQNIYAKDQTNNNYSSKLPDFVAYMESLMSKNLEILGKDTGPTSKASVAA